LKNGNGSAKRSMAKQRLPCCVNRFRDIIRAIETCAEVQQLMKRNAGIAVAVAVAALALRVHAATVVNPVSVTLTDADQFFPADHIIDGSGLSSLPNTGDPLPDVWTHAWDNPAGESWVSTDPGNFPSDWFLASGTIPTFVLDLGQNSLLSTVHLWAYSGGPGVAGNYQGNSAKTLELRFNTQVEGDTIFSKPPIVVNMDHGLVSETPAGSPMPRQDFSVGIQTARYVEMRITDNWYVAPGDGTTQDEHGHPMRGGDRIGLGEVRFSLVPEPLTSAFLASAAVLLVAGARRNRRRRELNDSRQADRVSPLR